MIKTSKEQFKQYLEGINQYQGVAFSLFEVYRMIVRKEKSIFEILNFLQPEG